MLKTFFVEDTSLHLLGIRVNDLLDKIQNENEFGFFNKIVDIQYQNQCTVSITSLVRNYYSVMIVVDYFKDE